MSAAASPKLESTLLRAPQLAGIREHPTTGVDHLLAALFDNASATAALAEFDVDPGRFGDLNGELIGQLILSPGTGVIFPRPPGTEAFERVLARARTRVERMGRTEVEGHDVLLALLDERTTKAAKILRRLGVRKRRLTAYIDHGLTSRVPIPPDVIDGDDGEDTDQPLPLAIEAAAIEKYVPDQRSAPVRIGTRDGRIVRVSDRDSALNASEEDFDRWRQPVLDHLREMLAAVGGFPKGTNHRAVRKRLESLEQWLGGSIPDVKDEQFRIGYEALRLGGLLDTYRKVADDLPDMNAATLRDLDHLHVQLMLGLRKLESWADFQRDAAVAPVKGEVVRAAAAETLDVTVTTLTRNELRDIVDPRLPATFRWIREGLDDLWEATLDVVYGAVRSFENLVIFLGQVVLEGVKQTVRIAVAEISTEAASDLLNQLAQTAQQLSAALPHKWAWLQPLLDFVARLHGW